MKRNSIIPGSKTILWTLAFVFSAVFANQTLAQDGAADVTIIDGLMWSLSTNEEDVVWELAEQYCQDLNLAGHDDWRLPTLNELEARLDPAREGSVAISSPLPQTTCCLWSSTNLVDTPPEEGHFYIDPLGEPAEYAWGFLYSKEGVRYYSAKFFPDGQALCVRD